MPPMTPTPSPSWSPTPVIWRAKDRAGLCPEPPHRLRQGKRRRESLPFLWSAFGKTGMIEPGGFRDAVHDRQQARYRLLRHLRRGTYVLDAGDYYFTAATDAHNAVKNILAAKGYTVSPPTAKMTADGRPDLPGPRTPSTPLPMPPAKTAPPSPTSCPAPTPTCTRALRRP